MSFRNRLLLGMALIIAAFIAASSTGYPLALRCLKTAIEALMDAPDGDDTARNALAAICGQWEAGL